MSVQHPVSTIPHGLELYELYLTDAQYHAVVQLIAEGIWERRDPLEIAYVIRQSFQSSSDVLLAQAIAILRECPTRADEPIELWWIDRVKPFLDAMGEGDGNGGNDSAGA